jgi:hypothetical protein
MMFNTTFNNISVISWRSVLLVKGQIWRFDGQIDICYTVRLQANVCCFCWNGRSLWWVKSKLKLENYLLFISNIKIRQLFTKFIRVSGHSFNKKFILFNGISSIKSGLFNIILLNKLFPREWLAVHFKKKWYSFPISFKLK